MLIMLMEWTLIRTVTLYSYNNNKVSSEFFSPEVKS